MDVDRGVDGLHIYWAALYCVDTCRVPIFDLVAFLALPACWEDDLRANSRPKVGDTDEHGKGAIPVD